jgi:hypothetical protein
MVTISYGVGNSLTKSEGDYRTIADLIGDANIQAGLGFDINQVDARVNGTIIDVNASVIGGMRIELIKKAGRKSDNDALTVDQQLSPIGIAQAIVVAVAAHATAAVEKFYDAVNKAEEAVSKEVGKAQREVLSGFKPFLEFVEGLTSQLVEQNYIDNVGSITIPQKVREELEQIAEAAEAGLTDVREALIGAEKAVNAWRKSTEADLHMCVTIADQRVVLAKVLKSDPTKAWTFSA